MESASDESLDAFASLANDSPDSIEDLDSLSIKIMSIHEEYVVNQKM